MHQLRASTWGIVALLVIHVTTAIRTPLLVGTATIMVAVVIAVTATKTATTMAETEIGVIVEAHLLLVEVDTPLTIDVAEATPAAHRLEEAALHLVVVVAQETTIRQLLQEGLLPLQHLPLNTHGGEYHLLTLVDSNFIVPGQVDYLCLSVSVRFILFLARSFVIPRHSSFLIFASHFI